VPIRRWAKAAGVSNNTVKAAMQGNTVVYTEACSPFSNYEDP
jgi:hypothetical protein